MNIAQIKMNEAEAPVCLHHCPAKRRHNVCPVFQAMLGLSLSYELYQILVASAPIANFFGAVAASMYLHWLTKI